MNRRPNRRPQPTILEVEMKVVSIAFDEEQGVGNVGIATLQADGNPFTKIILIRAVNAAGEMPGLLVDDYVKVTIN